MPSEGETVGLNVRVPVEKAASFGITARLLDAAGKEIAQARTEVKVGLAEDARVTVGPDGFLRVAGQQTFPIGLYSSGREEEMGKAGFTATHNYGITTGEPNEAINPNDAHLKELLDRSLANGLRMMVELPRKAIESGAVAAGAPPHRDLPPSSRPALLGLGRTRRPRRRPADQHRHSLPHRP